MGLNIENAIAVLTALPPPDVSTRRLPSADAWASVFERTRLIATDICSESLTPKSASTIKSHAQVNVRY